MSKFTIYNENASEIQYESDVKIENVLKFYAIQQNQILILSDDNLFTGFIDKNHLRLRLYQKNIIDIQYFNEMLYKISDEGCVFHTKLSDFSGDNTNDSWSEIVVRNVKMCMHGFKCFSDKIKIANVNCNKDGILFTSFARDLYGMGNFSEILKSDSPIKLDCFDGLKVLQVAMGDNFAVILTQKRMHSHHCSEYENSSSNEAHEVYYNIECPKCPSQNNKMYKNISKSTTETSMASSPSDTCDISDDNSKIANDLVPATQHNAIQTRDSTINFFLDRLSISSEDFLEAQTKLIKENVSKMVSEGVKTFSRHMSGSDSNEKLDNIKVEMVNGEREEPAERSHSMSDVSMNGSEYDFFYDIDDEEGGDENNPDDGMEESINFLCRSGNCLISTGVWSFGSINREGQLGTGDHVKRNIIIPVLKLQGQGVSKISCGKNHSIALTLDGRLFLWGSNQSKQISVESFDEYSTPKLLKNKEKVLDAICTDYSTIVLLNDLNIFDEKKSIFTNVLSSSFEITKHHKDEGAISTLNRPSFSTFFTSRNYYVVNHCVFSPIYDFLTNEQKFLHEILTTYSTHLKPFLKKTSSLPHSILYDSLCHLYLNIINMTAANVQTIKEYFHRHITCDRITFLKNLPELVSLYRSYLKKFCNLLCVNGYEHIVYLFKLDKPNVAVNVRKIFESPFRRIWVYTEIIDELMKYETDCTQILNDRKKTLDKFRLEKDLEVDKADRTIKFWKSIDKKLISELQEPERRLILDSKEVSLKLVPSTPFSTQRFILFSDYLCHHSNILVKHQLTTLWVDSISDQDSKKYLFRVVTPETTVVIAARNREDKMRWIEEISKCIKLSLNKPPGSKVPANRNTSYVFSPEHSIYPKVKYFGMWWNGQMHGIGRLEFPDGRVYSGLLTNNEIHGFGKLFTPNLGTYEGSFESGKYHGYGILEMKNNKERYKGNFRCGEFSGHGKLENDLFQYIGEFSRNMKNGYGVLDDRMTANKYLGFFENNKKHGIGILYTVEGDFFSGIFNDDNLTGDGIAILADGTYYRGELTLYGPAGKGVIYLEGSQNAEEPNLDSVNDVSLPTRSMIGSFTGTWKNIKIANGNLDMGGSDPEQRKSISIFDIDPTKKWCSLFKDWESEVFTENHRMYTNSSLWERISVYIVNAKRKEKLKSDNFKLKSTKSLLSTSASRLHRGLHRSTKICCNSETISIISSLSTRSNQYSKSSTLDIKDCGLTKQKSISSEMVNNECDNRTRKLEVEARSMPMVNDDLDGKILNSNENLSFDDTNSSWEKRKRHRERILETTPNFGIQKLTKEDVERIKEYLYEAFKDIQHPLGVLIAKISKSFHFSYGHWNNKKPTILTSHALAELESISKRVYQIVRRLFPALPETSVVIDDEEISHRTFYAALLSNCIYSSLFVLYASKCSPLDEICQRRIRFADKKSDEALLKFLNIEAKLLPLVKHTYFREAIKSFQFCSSKFCPLEMLSQIKRTYEFITKASYEIFGDSFVLNADYFIPLSIFIILRANIPHVGAELLLLENLLESDAKLCGEEGACFTHIKASYGYIIGNSFFED